MDRPKVVAQKLFHEFNVYFVPVRSNETIRCVPAYQCKAKRCVEQEKAGGFARMEQ